MKGRTALAAVLTAVAVTLPCVAWYVVGCREAERQAVELASEAARAAAATATELAAKLQARLEGLRETEARRPYYQYQNLYHDPKGAYAGDSVIPSPLAEGPSDPFVRAYFQVDATGQVTLPTLNEEVPEATTNAVAQRVVQRELQQALQSCASCVALLQQPPPAQNSQQQALSVDAYMQNTTANQVWSELKSGKLKSAPRAQPNAQVHVGIDEFTWQTLSLPGGAALAALRLVATPDGQRTQGFVIEPVAVNEALKGAAFPARFIPGNNGRPVGKTGWSVAIDAADALGGLPLRRNSFRAGFQRQFVAGASAAVLAGLCVIVLVRQSDRLARQRSQFAAAAAHELRTPLAGLRMYSEMLAEGLGDPARAGEYARRIATEAERLGRVVANVLGFTRLERGNLHAQVERGDLAAVVREAVECQRSALETAGLRVELAVEADVPPVGFDRDAVVQIIQNLLDNAEKYTRDVENRQVRVAVMAGGFSVTDNGRGLPEGIRRNLFRPFVRGQATDAPAGLGLGLALVQALVRAQGAEVRYVSAPGEGASFVVHFPG